MSRRAAAAVVVSGAAAVLLTACSSGSPGQGVGGPTSTGPHSSAATAYPTATTGATPDATQSAALVAAWRTIDPAVVTGDDQAVRAAVLICSQLQDGGDATTVVPPAFTGVTLSPQQATAVAAAVESTFCPTGASSNTPGGDSPAPTGS